MRKISVIGSCAHINGPCCSEGYYDEFICGEDLDIIGSYDDIVNWAKSRPSQIMSLYPIKKGQKLVVKFQDGLIAEAEITWPGSTTEMLHNMILEDAVIYKNTLDDIVCDAHFYVPKDASLLYTLKMTHRFLKNSPHFKKTMEDVLIFQAVLDYKPGEIPEKYKEFFKKREAETYNYKSPSLKDKKDDFFKERDSFYVYDHDDIHEAVKIGDIPAYQHFVDKEHGVWCDKKKFFECDENIRLAAVLEETYVLALERSLVPNDFIKIQPSWAFDMALEKICTSITSGWFREFAYYHYDEVREIYHSLGSETFVNKFKAALKQNLIKPFRRKDAN